MWASKYAKFICLFLLLFISRGNWVRSARAQCAPNGDNNANAIVCDSTDTNGIDGQGGDDQITVTDNAGIISNPAGDAIQGGADNDKIDVDSATVTGGTNGDGIDGGDGDDEISVYGSSTVTGGANGNGINGGTGTDSVFVGGGTQIVCGLNSEAIDTGDDDDEVDVTDTAQIVCSVGTGILTGEGFDQVTVTGNGVVDGGDAGMDTGIGNDKIIVNGNASVSGDVGIITGDGNDTVLVANTADVTGATDGISTGNGDDTVTATGDASISAGTNDNAIDTGAGNDTVVVGDVQVYGVINGGAGTDTLTFTQTVQQSEYEALAQYIISVNGDSGTHEVFINGQKYTWTSFEALVDMLVIAAQQVEFEGAAGLSIFVPEEPQSGTLCDDGVVKVFRDVNNNLAVYSDFRTDLPNGFLVAVLTPFQLTPGTRAFTIDEPHKGWYVTVGSSKDLWVFDAANRVVSSTCHYQA